MDDQHEPDKARQWTEYIYQTAAQAIATKPGPWLRHLPQEQQCDPVSFWQRLAAPSERANADAWLKRAFVAGTHSRTVADAFFCAYQYALRALLCDRGYSEYAHSDQSIAMCVTESGGGHPRAIETSANEHGGKWRLDGHKKWTSHPTEEGHGIVIASLGAKADGRPDLGAFWVPLNAPGVRLVPMNPKAPAPFVPQIVHCELDFDGVGLGLDHCLSGDGYTDYAKPFRQYEDLFVMASGLGLLWQVGTSCGADQLSQQVLVLAQALGALAHESPAQYDAMQLLTLGGFMEPFRQIWSRLGAAMEPEAAQVWGRDGALWMIAQNARDKRNANAWRKVGAMA